jgi:hypothetical protein
LASACLTEEQQEGFVASWEFFEWNLFAWHRKTTRDRRAYTPERPFAPNSR